MKNNLITGLICFSIVILYQFWYVCAENRELSSQLNKLEWKLELASAAEKINQSQISDMEWQLSSAKTYEDGFRDAMMYSESQAFVNGYHRAIGQNTEEIVRLNALLDSKVKTATPQQIAEQAQP